MKHDFDIHAIDINEIELEARRLRAQAIRDGFVALGAWLRTLRLPSRRRTV